MNSPLASPPSAAPTDSNAPKPAAQGWVDTLRAIFSELPGLVSDRVELLTLELKQAGAALAQILVLLVAMALLGVTAWLALWAGVGVGLVQLGLHWTLSLLAVLLLNAGFAWLALGRLRRLLPLLSLPATRRHLVPSGITGPAEVPKGAAAPAASHPRPVTPSSSV